jgi:hypothetical protein
MRNALESLGQRIPEVEGINAEAGRVWEYQVVCTVYRLSVGDSRHKQFHWQDVGTRDGVVRQKASMLSADLQRLLWKIPRSMILWLLVFALRKWRANQSEKNGGNRSILQLSRLPKAFSCAGPITHINNWVFSFPPFKSQQQSSRPNSRAPAPIIL